MLAVMLLLLTMQAHSFRERIWPWTCRSSSRRTCCRPACTCRCLWSWTSRPAQRSSGTPHMTSHWPRARPHLTNSQRTPYPPPDVPYPASRVYSGRPRAPSLAIWRARWGLGRAWPRCPLPPWPRRRRRPRRFTWTSSDKLWSAGVCVQAALAAAWTTSTMLKWPRWCSRRWGCRYHGGIFGRAGQRQADQAAGTATDATTGVRGAAAQRRVHGGRRPRGAAAAGSTQGAPALSQRRPIWLLPVSVGQRGPRPPPRTGCRRPRWRPAEPNEKEKKKKKIRGIMDIFLIGPTWHG